LATITSQYVLYAIEFIVSSLEIWFDGVEALIKCG
jgi:hypothetical protein